MYNTTEFRCQTQKHRSTWPHVSSLWAVSSRKNCVHWGKSYFWLCHHGLHYHQVVGLFWCLLFTVSGTGSKRICFDARIETIDAKNCVDVVIMFEAISSTMEYGNSETKSLIGQQRQKGVANHVAPALSPLTSGASKRTTPRSKQYGCVEGSTRICFV